MGRQGQGQVPTLLPTRWFGVITQKAIRRGSFHKVGERTRKINAFVEHDNTQTRPFMWVATAESILAKIQRPL